MSRLGLVLVSLVAALPAAFLGYLMVDAFLHRLEAMTTGFQVMAGATLALSAVVVFIPVGVLLFAGKAEGAPQLAAAAGGKQGSASPAPVEDLDDADAFVGDEDEAMETSEAEEIDDFDLGGEAVSDDDLESSDALDAGDDDWDLDEWDDDD